MQLNLFPIGSRQVNSYYGVNSQKLQRHYKHKISGFKDWKQLSHAQDYFIYPENITNKISIDEESLSKGELYTFVTNKNINVKNKRSMVAIINNTSAKTIQAVLEKTSLEKRKQIKEATIHMARNMELAARENFSN